MIYDRLKRWIERSHLNLTGNLVFFFFLWNTGTFICSVLKTFGFSDVIIEEVSRLRNSNTTYKSGTITSKQHLTTSMKSSSSLDLLIWQQFEETREDREACDTAHHHVLKASFRNFSTVPHSPDNKQDSFLSLAVCVFSGRHFSETLLISTEE